LKRRGHFDSPIFQVMKVEILRPGTISDNLLEEKVDLVTIIVLNNRTVWKDRIHQDFRR
jgi:hypothetical protein